MLHDVQKRFRIAIWLFVGLFFLLSVRVVYLSFFNRNLSAVKTSKSTQRGVIYDRRGIELAVSKEAYTIGISTPQVYDVDFTASQLAPVLKMPQSKISQLIREKTGYFLLVREIEEKMAMKVIAMSLPGIRVEREFKRIYPQGTLASNLIGFTGFDDDNALAGLENTFNLELLSTADEERQRGNDIHLSIDSLIQYKLERALGKTYAETKSKKAVGIFMDVRTGKILAMASYPTFNPNEFNNYPQENQTNWAIRHVYEPGSTMKIFIAMILFNEGLLKKGETFHCPGFVEFGKSVIRCQDKHGHLDMDQILAVSCNVGIIKAASKIDDPTYHRYLDMFKFGKRSGFSLHENKGYLQPLNRWTPATPYFLSIGQGLSVTPIQLVASAAALVNGGELLDPMAVTHITNSYGELVHSFQKRGEKLPIKSDSTKKLMVALMRAVKTGTGKNAYLQDYSIGGKTGTGQKAKPGLGYQEGLWSASFLGFFPAEDPRVVGLVLFDEPGGGVHSGGGLAAPVFREVVESILPIIDKSDSAMKYTLFRKNPTQFRADYQIVPDLTGFSKQEVIRITTDYKVKSKLVGEGFVYEQDPNAGQSVQENRAWNIYFKK